MNAGNDDRFQRLLEAIQEARVQIAQAKIRVNLEASQSEKISLLMEYLEEVKKLSSLENELLIMHLFEVKAGMDELKVKMETLRVSTAGRF